VTSLEKSSRPVARIQEQNERAIDESVQEQASAPNTETKIPCQKARLADNEIEDREYDPMPELTNPDERDKVDHRKLQFKDNEPSVRSSPPYSPPKVILPSSISNPRSQSSNASKQSWTLPSPPNPLLPPSDPLTRKSISLHLNPTIPPSIKDPLEFGGK